MAMARLVACSVVDCTRKTRTACVTCGTPVCEEHRWDVDGSRLCDECAAAEALYGDRLSEEPIARSGGVDFVRRHLAAV